MTCQKTRAALSQKVGSFHDRDFFREPFTADELRALSGGRIADIFSAKSPSVKKLGLDPAAMSEDEMLDWMLKEPRLIKRPLLTVGGTLAIQPKIADLDRLLS